MIWFLTAVFSLLLVVPAHAEDPPAAKKCIPSGFCVGDPIVSGYDGKKGIITDFEYNSAKIKFESGEISGQPTEYLGLAREGACLSGKPSFCVGKYALLKDDWGGVETKILAITNSYGGTVTAGVPDKTTPGGERIQRFYTDSFDPETYAAPSSKKALGYYEKCAGDICPGATGYAEVKWGTYSKVTVLGTNSRGDQVKVTGDGLTTPLAIYTSMLALDKPGECSKLIADACVGTYGNYRDLAGNMVSHQVVAVNRNGNVLISDKGRLVFADASAYFHFTKEPAPNTPPPPFLEKCLGKICPGDTGYYGYSPPMKVKILGTDESGRLLRGKIEGRPGIETLHPGTITIDKPGLCSDSHPVICVGSFASGPEGSFEILAIHPASQLMALKQHGELIVRDFYGFTSFSKTAPPPYVEKCVKDICPGMEEYFTASSEGFKVKVLGTDDSGLYVRGTVEGKPGVRTFSPDALMNHKPGTCSSYSTKICVGAFANRADDKGKIFSEPVVAISPGRGYFLVSSGDKLVLRDSYAYRSFTPTPAPPYVAECLNSWCPGNEVYGFNGGIPVKGKVVGRVFDSHISIQPDDGGEVVNTYHHSLASAKPGTCSQNWKDACVGSYLITELEGVPSAVRIVAVSNAQDTLVIEENGKLFRFPIPYGATFTKNRPPRASYRWVIENGAVLGCQEDIEYFPSEDPVCKTADAPASVECTGRRTSELVKDIKACRQKLPVGNGWIKHGETLLCASLLETEVDGKKKNLVLDWLNDAECSHKWFLLDESNCDFTRAGRFDFHPNNKFGLGDLIPEIMNLKEKETIPAEVYKKHDSKKIALTIHYKMYKDYEQTTANLAKNPNYDFLDGTAIQLAFWDKYLDSIVAKGFLNQHEVFTTSGCLCPENRAKAEDNMLGYKLEPSYQKDASNLVNKVRPKYSLLGLQTGDINDMPVTGTNSSPIKASHYGNIVAVMNHEVKDRTTFTMTDSLGIAENSKTEKLKKLRTTRYLSDESLRSESDTYVEAQVWGELKMSDVHHFLINCGNKDPLPAATMTKLKALGKDIFACQHKKDRSGTIIRFVEGDKIP